MVNAINTINVVITSIMNLERLGHDFHKVSEILGIQTYFFIVLQEDLTSHIKFHLGRPSAFF